MEERKKRRSHRKLPIIAVIFLLLLFFFFRFLTTERRMAVAFVGNPVSVLSYDPASRSFILISIPSSAVIESVHGYGQYSLESLWNLGTIEGTQDKIFAQSIEELLGIPVAWYIGEKDHPLRASPDPFARAKRILSVPATWSFFRGAYKTNMSPIDFFRIAWVFIKHRPNNVKLIDLESTLVSSQLPDGSTVLLSDGNRIDQKIGSAFEQESIRKEALSVAVFNTTPTSSLGTRVGRLLSHMGMFVVTVDNRRPTVDTCIVESTKEQANSKTVGLIVAVYGCSKLEKNGNDRADVVVTIGSSYQKRFESL